MSLAGPFGEAPCGYCNHLIDLRDDGTFERHTGRDANGNAMPRCEGSLRTPVKDIPPENEKLAFSGEPVTHPCPVCNTLVTVTTIAQTPDNYRMGSHYRIAGHPPSGYCQSTGVPLKNLPQLVETLKPKTVEVRPGETNQPWVDIRGWLSS